MAKVTPKRGVRVLPLAALRRWALWVGMLLGFIACAGADASPSAFPSALRSSVSPGQLDGLLVRMTLRIASLGPTAYCIGQDGKMSFSGQASAVEILRQPTSGSV